MRFTVFAALLCVAALPALRADETPDGHSTHGEAFNEGPRQAAVLMPGMAQVHLEVSTRSSRAQKFFDQGVAQLHGFWFFEAERSFRQVAALDTNCAMAYWGMAMANENNEKRAKEFIQTAVAHRAQASPREQMWIDGLARFHDRDKRDTKQRERDYVRSLIELTRAHTNELEAKAVLAWKLWDLKVREKPYDNDDAVNKLIDGILAVAPMHPAHHYRIHLWDSASKPDRALGSAALCGQASPGIAHMWHMPGHTFSKLKRYDDAAWQQEASARVDHAHMMKYLVLPDQIHNYAHNNEWLIRDLNHVGRAGDAVSLAKNMIELPRHPKWNTPDKSRGSASYGRTRLLESLVRYELWDELVTLADTMYLAPVTNAAAEIPRLRAIGLAAAGLGQAELLSGQIRSLEHLASTLPKPAARTNTPVAASTNRQAAAASKSTNAPASSAPKSQPKGKRPASGGGNSSSSPATLASNALAELRFLTLVAKGDKSAAARQLELAKDLPKERLARHQVRLGNLSAAEQSARDAVRGATNEVIPLATLVEVLHAAGKLEAARESFEQLRTVGRDLDAGTPIYKRLTALAAAWGISANWQVKGGRPTDVGRRPSLDSLGPYRWSPTKAPEWSLRDAEGRRIALDQFRGKPVLVVFYLGHGCLHCIQQLQALVPAAAGFKEAGISIVAVSKDSRSGLKESVEKIKADGGLPFPLVSDDKLGVFKKYRCYDDFERTALHGTFLVDASGNIRWLDISYQPFMEMNFLLGECKRLLNLPGQSPAAARVRQAAAR